jgi:hypothetical protein
MTTQNTKTGEGSKSAAQIIEHPHVANRLAVVIDGKPYKNEWGAVCSFREEKDAEFFFLSNGISEWEPLKEKGW